MTHANSATSAPNCACPRAQLHVDKSRRTLTNLAEQRPERLLEVAHRNALQIKDRQKRIQAARPPGPARQDRLRETDAIRPCFAGTPVAQLRPLHRERANAGLHLALRARAVPNRALAPVR